MGKYARYEKPGLSRAERTKLHPVWSGIGCILLVLIPIIAYAGAVLLVEANLEQHWLPAPRELYQTINLPFIGAAPHLYANLLIAGVLSLLGFAVQTLLFAIMAQAAGIHQDGPYDAPPERSRPRSTARRR